MTGTINYLTDKLIASFQNGDSRNLGDVKPRITEESNDKSKIWKLTEISEPSQCRSMKLPENVRVTKVCYLCAIFALSTLLAPKERMY